MSNILSIYYKTYYTKNNTINITKNFFTPNKKLIQKKYRLWIYLSENNTLLISKKNGIPPLSLMMNKKFIINKFTTNSEKESITKSINFNSEKEKISQNLRYKDNNNNLFESLDLN